MVRPAKKRPPSGSKRSPDDQKRPFTIAGTQVEPGERRLVELHVTRLYTSGGVTIPIHVLHGRQQGPRLFVSAAVHGDEINGVEAIRRILKMRLLDRLRGTLLAIPVVNVHGFLAKKRYTPDRRDLNRSFPGMSKGSLAARVAWCFMDEVVGLCTHGVDLHTGSNHRTNLPQIRANLDEPETRKLARAFGVPVIIDSKLRDGSLRQAAMERGIPMLLYEGGEALRFERIATQAAVRGVVGVMKELGMLPGAPPRKGRRPKPFVAKSTRWIRAPVSGMLVSSLRLGATVSKGEKLGFISDPYGQEETPVVARKKGIVIGLLNLPLVNEGDALFHVAHGDDLDKVATSIQEYEEDLDPLPVLDPEDYS